MESSKSLPPEPTSYQTVNDLQLSEQTEILLVYAVDHQLQIKQAHWNVKVPSFIGLHEIFYKMTVSVAGYVDMIAKRIVQLGGLAEDTVRMAANRSRFSEYPLTLADGMAHVNAVPTVLSTFGAKVRSSISETEKLNDTDNADHFTEVSREIDK